MAGKVSKNQRTSKKPELAANQAATRVIIPLNFGKHAYVSVAGKTRHVATTSEDFVQAVRDLGADRAGQVSSELDALNVAHPGHGWDATKARLVDAGAI